MYRIFSKTSPGKKVVMTAFSVCLVILAVNYNQYAVANIPQPEPLPQTKQLAQVGIEPLKSASFSPHIKLNADFKARFELALSSEVTGQVESINPQFASGHYLAKGTVIASIEKDSYRQAITMARLTVAKAEQTLIEELRRQSQAIDEWKLSGETGKPLSPLVLRKPQIKVAQLELEQAEEALKIAKNNLKKTDIVLPFDAVIIERSISPGQYLQQGATIAMIYSADSLEARLPLTEQQWRLLGNSGTLQQLQVTVKDLLQQHQWQAKVARQEHYIDQSRQRALVVSIDAPLQQSLAIQPGTFAEIILTGIPLENLFKIPAYALTSKQEIWTVEHDVLSSHKISPRFSEGGFLFIPANQLGNKKEINLVMRPSLKLSQGQQVAAFSENDLEEALSINE